MCAGKFLTITSSPLGYWAVFSRANIGSLTYPATKMIYRIQTTCFGQLLRILWVWISWVIILLIMVVDCWFLLHFLCLRSLEEIVYPVKTTVSVSHTW